MTDADSQQQQQQAQQQGVMMAGGEAQPPPIRYVDVNPAEFDLNAFVAPYQGHGKILRLLFIGEHCKQLQVQAIMMAIDLLKTTLQTQVYGAVVETYSSILPANYQLDKNWMVQTDRQAVARQEKVEAELNQAKTQLVKEKIRIGHNDMGHYYYDRGDLSSALKCYVRTRDYCTSPKHMIEMCLNMIKVAIELSNFSHVSNYISKAEQTVDAADLVTVAKIRAINGLLQLHNKKYKNAGRAFYATPIQLADTFADVITVPDIALYSVLCGLSNFDRNEIKEKLLDAPNFRQLCENTPELTEILEDFYESRYGKCLTTLESMKAKLLLDPFLHEHVDALLAKIRSRALVLYFSPFSSIDLATMATAFNTDVDGVEKEFAALIVEGQITARIDSHNKILFARKVDQRTSTFQKTIQVGEDYQENTQNLLLRLNMMRQDFQVSRGGRSRMFMDEDRDRSGGGKKRMH